MRTKSLIVSVVLFNTDEEAERGNKYFTCGKYEPQ